MGEVNIVNNGKPYFFRFDISKEGGMSARITDYLKTRVNDNGKKVPVKWFDQGNEMNVHGLSPFIQGGVGHWTPDDDNNLLPGPDVVYRDWQGTPADVADDGMVYYTLEDQFFCKQGQFKGIFGLRDSNGNVFSSVNIIFEIQGNDFRIHQTIEYYSSELEKMKARFSNDTQQVIKDARDAYNKQTQVSHDASVATQAALDKTKATADQLAIAIGQQQDYINARNIVTIKDFDALSDKVTKYVTDNYVQPEAYDNLDALKKAYPTGAKGIFVTIDTGHFYFWQDNAWRDCGSFQSAGIADNSINIEKLSSNLQNGFYPEVNEVKIDHINTGYISQFDGSVKTDKPANPDDGDPIHTDMIAVKPDEEYYVYTQNYYDGKAVIFFNQDKVVSSLPAEKDVKRKNIKITIPHNVNGLILNSTRKFLPRLFKVESYFEIPQPVKSIASLIKDQEYNFEKVELTKKAEVGFWDIDHDGNFSIEPVNKTNAQISYEPIKVEPFEVYRISGCSAWSARLYEIIDAKGHLIDYCSTEMSNNMTETIMIPENGSYLEINEYLLNAQTTVEKANFVKKNLPLSGKTWTAVGDSWTQLFSDQKKSYVNDVAEITGATAINSGGGGTGYITGGPNNWNYQFYKHPVDSNSDIVTVFGSFNDAYDSNFKFGKQGDTDTNTLWGALKATLDHIYSSNFDAQVGIIAPGPWGVINQHLDATIKMSTLGSHSDSEVNDMPIADFAEKYVQTLHDFAKLNSLPFLDLYHYSGLRPWDSTFINKHYHGMNDTDTTHPNSEAMKKFIAPKVAEFIKSFA